LYVYGSYIDEVLLLKAGSNDYYYVHDHLYSPVALVDISGNVKERYEYDAYGQPTIWDATFTNTRETSNYGNPYLFTGRRVDILDNCSLKIQYNRNRYYDYYTGRWLTHDPLAYVDGMNLYEYVRSNPVVFVDPDGQAVVTVAVCGGAVTLTAAEAAAAAFGVSVVTCMMMPDCRELAFSGAAKAAVDAIDAVAAAVKKFCKIRCEFKPQKPHHWWWRPRLGWPPWKKCYMKHIRVTCYFEGIKGSKWFEKQIPYGPCYKYPGGAGGITH